MPILRWLQTTGGSTLLLYTDIRYTRAGPSVFSSGADAKTWTRSSSQKPESANSRARVAFAFHDYRIPDTRCAAPPLSRCRTRGPESKTAAYPNGCRGRGRGYPEPGWFQLPVSALPPQRCDKRACASNASTQADVRPGPCLRAHPLAPSLQPPLQAMTCGTVHEGQSGAYAPTSRDLHPQDCIVHQQSQTWTEVYA